MDKWEKEFEERIRKKLSDAPVDFDPSAWKRMEQRLYPDAAGGGWASRWWLGAAAAVVLLAAAGIWSYTTYFSAAPAHEDQLSSVNGNQPPATDSQGAGEERITGEERAGRTGEEERAAGEAGRSPVTSQPPPTGGESQTPRAEHGQTDKLGPAKEQALAQASGLFKKEQQPGWPPTGGWQDAPEALSTKLAAVSANQLSSRLAVIGTGRRPLEMKQPANLAKAFRPVPPSAGQPPATGPQAGGETGGKKMSLSLGVLAAPDLNGVGGFSNSKPGINMGLGLGLHFNDRLSLHSGVIYSRKPYNALPSDYQMKYSPQGLVNIAAVCDVIDIPLDLRYTIYRRGSNSIAFRAGLSSYLMLREKYDYQYDYEPERQYEYKNENRHFMGIGNFGVSLERKINDHMSLGLEPFVKVPLTGIGHGNVRLVSAGAALRLNLDLSKKRKISINK